jgi:hypothetical protein
MPQEEYWPQVVAGYRANARVYQDQARHHMARIDQLVAVLRALLDSEADAALKTKGGA